MRSKSNILMEAYRETRNKGNKMNTKIKLEFLQIELPHIMVTKKALGKLSMRCITRNRNWVIENVSNSTIFPSIDQPK